jgi:hypothetical protein
MMGSPNITYKEKMAMRRSGLNYTKGENITGSIYFMSAIANLKYSTIRIFYTMERIIHLITMSLFLAAMVSIVIINPVQASPPREWCWKVGGAGMCFDNKEECRKGVPSSVSATCQKGVTN